MGSAAAQSPAPAVPDSASQETLSPGKPATLPVPAPPAALPKWKHQPGTYALFETAAGNIVVRLMPEVAPKAVANFLGLASGTKEWTDAKTRAKRKSQYFDGQIFHRVTDFMIQAGDPTGAGNGGPGYKFEDETTLEVIFDRAGRLAMANNGPGTNGSQFFITRKPTPWLNHKHTIFGQVVDGQPVVNEIGNGKATNERPVSPIRFKVRIEEVKG
jgi:peptidyl-prolyl cis-trans isomerase A (cyclophilin A)